MADCNNNLLALISHDKILTEEDIMILTKKLWNLLANRTERYTMGDSSSIPIETAEELMKSISFTIGLITKTSLNSVDLLLKENFEVLLKQGRERIISEIEAGKELLCKVLDSTPTPAPLFYEDTLVSLNAFFKNYDFRFFAHITPHTFYQLQQPISQKLQGIEFVNEYLRRLLYENETGLTAHNACEKYYCEEVRSSSAMQFTDNDTMDDELLRELIFKINDCNVISDKIALAKREVHSLRDMVEVLNICFWSDEINALFDELSSTEISLLIEYINTKTQDWHSETGWETLISNYTKQKANIQHSLDLPPIN